MNELALSAIFCTLIAGGQTEVSHGYSAGYDLHRIRVDCETPTHVYEIGLDKRSARDSVHQALFAAHLSDKVPVVLIIDRDGRIGPYETQIKATAEMAGVAYETLSRDFLIRWQMTSWLRNYTPNPNPGF